ncbi:MAG: M14 family zinc carboxypeptidase [Pseudomonadota bacterium]
MSRTAHIASAAILGALAMGSASAQILEFTESTNSDTQIAVGYPIPIPVESQLPVDGFRSFASLFARHQDLALSSAHVRSVIVGQTFNGRDITAYVIGDDDTTMAFSDLTEPAVLMNGTIHAREWASPEVVTALFEALVAQEDDGAIVQYILENVNFVLLPMLNIDGYLQTQRFPTQFTPTPDDEQTGASNQFSQPRDGRMRRKNMREVDESLDTDDDRLLGIDLNRNNDAFFTAPFGGNSTDPTSLVFRGEFAASEPEIQALLAAADLAPVDRLRLYIDAHSFSRVYFVPATNNNRRNNLTTALAVRMGEATTTFGQPRYEPVVGTPGQDISTTATFFAFEYEVPAWTLEIEPPCGFPGLPCGGANYAGGIGVNGDGFILPNTEVARAREENTLAHILGLYHQAGPPTVRRVVLQEEASGNTLLDAAWAPTGDGATRTLNGANSELTLSEGTAYRLWIGFDKPMRYRDEGGAVVDYPGQAAAGAEPIATLRGVNIDGAAFNFDVPFTLDDWLDTPGDAPSGYTRYRDDAIAASFTLPSSLQISTEETDVTLVLNVRDFAEQLLDADPSTIADFADGVWVGYERTGGFEGDAGGEDETLSFKVVGTATEPSPAPSSGGGGALGGVALLGLALCLLTGRRRLLTVAVRSSS